MSLPSFFTKKNATLIIIAVLLLPVFFWSFSWRRAVSVTLDDFWRQGLIIKVENGSTGTLSSLLELQPFSVISTTSTASQTPASNYLTLFCDNQKKFTRADCRHRLSLLGGGDGLGWTLASNGAPLYFLAIQKSSWSDVLSFNPQIWSAYLSPRFFGENPDGSRLWRYRQYEISLSKDVSPAQIKSLVNWFRWSDLSSWHPISGNISIQGYLNPSQSLSGQSWWPQFKFIWEKFNLSANQNSADPTSVPVKPVFFRATLGRQSWQWQVFKTGQNTSAPAPQCAAPDSLLTLASSGWRWCQNNSSDALWNMASYWLAWYPDLRATWQDLQAKNFYQFDANNYLSWLRQPLCLWSLENSSGSAGNSSPINLNQSNPIYLLALSQAPASWPAQLEKDWQSFIALNHPEIKSTPLPDKTLMREIIPAAQTVSAKNQILGNGLTLRSLETAGQNWGLHYISNDNQLILANRADWLENLSNLKPAWSSVLKDTSSICASGKFDQKWSALAGWQFWQISEDNDSWVLKMSQ